MKGKKTAALLSLCALLASCAKEGARKEAETGGGKQFARGGKKHKEQNAFN